MLTESWAPDTDKNHRSIFLSVKSLKEFSLEQYQYVGFQNFQTGLKLRWAACLFLQFLRFEYLHYDISDTRFVFQTKK